jgi:hypothetical protein
MVVEDAPKMAWWAGLALLLVRGLLLWFVVPVVAIIWLVLWPLFRRSHVSLGALLGWADLSLIAALHRSLLRIGTPTPLDWTALRDVSTLTHRISILDPY